MSNKVGNYRWVICGLVFFATTINYLDRAVISLLKKTLAVEFSWTESDYANIVVVFQVCYALGLLVAGNIIDKLGTKIGYAFATALWSLAAVGHALVGSTGGFMLARGFLGVTEAGNFPAAIKTTAEWFPKKERALATGIFNSGANIGAIVAPLSVPFIANMWGWKWAFIITGAIGFVWLIFWFLFYEVPARSKKISKLELQYISSDEVGADDGEPTKPSLAKLLSYRQTWAFSIGKFLTDPVWWFYLFWLPDFLQKEYQLTSTQISFPVAMAYTMATFGSVLGGWLPMYFTKIGLVIFKARRQAMLIYAIAILPIVAAQYLGKIHMWAAIFVIGLAMAAHQAWSANIFTTVSDMFPKKVIASVTGIGGMFGALGGIILAKSAGVLFDYYKGLGTPQTGYFIMFIICGGAYLLAWFIMRALVPKQAEVKL